MKRPLVDEMLLLMLLMYVGLFELVMLETVQAFALVLDVVEVGGVVVVVMLLFIESIVCFNKAG